ncbi:MAG: hypothetical protein WAT61_02415 [Flavobacteriales bacterium]|jgi:ligand-binding sensor domain-containing protein
MRPITFLSVLLVSFCTNGQWQHTNTSPQIQTIATQGDTVLAGTAGSGVAVSFDGADSWTSISNWTEFTDPYIRSLLIDGDDFYAGTLTGLYRSNDGGTQWYLISNGLVGSQHDTAVNDILKDGQYLFLAVISGIYRSADNGANWTSVNSGFSGGAWCLVKHGPYIFVGGSGTGVFRSSTNGDSWTESNLGLTSGNVHDLLSVGNDLFVASDQGVARSSDSGDSWSSVNNGILNTNISKLLTVNGLLIAASSGGGIYLSTNNGANWSTINGGLDNTIMTSLAANDTYVFAGNTHNGAVAGDVMRQGISMLTGITEYPEASHLRLYPSITASQFTIEDDDPFPSDRSVQVLDPLGRQLKAVHIGRASRATIELEGAAGYYNIIVQSAGRRIASYNVVKCP